jgi:hypothetical protein
MCRIRCGVVLVAMFVSCLAQTRPASGQTGPLAATPEPPAITPGQEVWITARSRRVIHGAVAGVSSEGIDVAVGRDVRRVVMSDVVRVQVPGGRATGKGALIGALAGGVALAMAMAVAESDCDGIVCFEGSGFIAAGAALGAGVGAGAGALIGSQVRQRRTVYPVRASGRRGLTIAPILPPAGAGAAIVTRW